MPFELNEKVKNLMPYDPIEGDFPIRLDANESFLPLSEQECDGIFQATNSALFRRYPDSKAGKLCQVAAAFYDTKPEFVTAFNGADEALFLLCTAFLGAQKPLMCFELDFAMYQFYASLTGFGCIKVPKRADFTIDTKAAIDIIFAKKSAVFVFSNPCNPTSLLLPKDRVRQMIRAAEKVGTLVVLDEAYMDFCAESLIDEVEQHSNLLILRTCSKAPGLAGLRLGFSIANEELTRVMRAVKSPYNVGVLTQEIGAQLLSQRERIILDIEAIQASTKELSQGLRELNLQVIGDSANFVFVKDAAYLFEELKAQGIVVRRFKEHLRISAGSKEENNALLSAIRRLL